MPNLKKQHTCDSLSFELRNTAFEAREALIMAFVDNAMGKTQTFEWSFGIEWEKLPMKIVSPQIVTPQVTKTKIRIVQAFFIGNLILEIRQLTSIVSRSSIISESTMQLTAAKPLDTFPTFVTPECSLPCSQEPTPPQSSHTNCITSNFFTATLVLS